jgi:hypothetical protein
MSVFSTKMAVAEGAPPDPTKHVNFTYGMVLGAADFKQEFGYLSSRDQWMCRDLLGYGTVSGLSVTIAVDATGPRVIVNAGVAVTPRGELVRVPLAQCANLNDWLSGADQVKHLQNRGTPLSTTTDRADVYVALCYRGCPTDKVPIPGEPCRHEDDLTAPSRLMDDFTLELRWDPPEQPDEAALRDFVDWLSRIPIVDGPSSLPIDKFLDAIRDAAFVVGSPPASPPHEFMYGSPPATLEIGAADACRYLRAAYRVWVTELRPKWGASWWGAQPRCADGGPADRPTPESCLLLVRLDVPLVRKSIAVGSGWEVSSTLAVGIDEETRPFLVPLRMLQEWLWCGGSRAGAGGAFVAAGPASSLVAAGTLVVGAPASGQYSLKAALTGTPGEVQVTFNAATPPPGFDYAVTATPKVGASIANPRIEFKSLVPGGFVIIVKNNTTLATAAALNTFSFMVQVTRFSK